MDIDFNQGTAESGATVGTYSAPTRSAPMVATHVSKSPTSEDPTANRATIETSIRDPSLSLDTYLQIFAKMEKGSSDTFFCVPSQIRREFLARRQPRRSE